MVRSVRRIPFDAKEYPPLLREVPDRPAVVYLRGEATVLGTRMIAVVGTRSMTEYGSFVTQTFVRGLVAAGFTIVSGLALGVDGQSHRTALQSAGRTIAVLAHGLDRVSPAKHENLAGDILTAGGALVSEYEFGAVKGKYSFARRNRIIAGLCEGVLVTEAAHASGTKITARFAAEYGRPVFAVPGPVTSQYAEGTKDLVNLGAKLVTSVSDILEELPIGNLSDINRIADNLHVTLHERSVLAAFGIDVGQGLTLDDLQHRTALPFSVLQSILLSLEIRYLVRRVGQRYVQVATSVLVPS